MSLPTQISDNPTEAGDIADLYSLEASPPSQLQPYAAGSTMTISEVSTPSTLVTGSTIQQSTSTSHPPPITERERNEQLREEIATNRALQETKPTPIPPLLLQTMSESVRRSNDDDAARDIILDVVQMLSDDQNAVMRSEFIDNDGVVRLNHPRFRQDTPIGTEPAIYSMIRSLVLDSKRVRSLLPEKQRKLVKTFNETSSENDLMDFLMHRLPLELSLTADVQERIWNDVLDNRYYRLLLPDRLDCLDGQQQQSSVDDRCSLCQGDLGTIWGTSELRCCSRQLCSACMNQAKAHSQCPHCSSFVAERSELSHV